MKLSPLLLLLPLAAWIPIAAAEDDWRNKARDFLKEHNFAPIEIKPDTRFQTDLSRERWTWMERVLLPVLDKHLTKWPTQAALARSFVKQALQAKIHHPDTDRARTPEMLEMEGRKLALAEVDEPLVLFATAWAAWEWRESYTDARAKLRQAARHKLTKNYPAALLLMIRTLIRDIEDDRNRSEPAHEEDYYQAAMLAAKDPASYGPADDEILWHDVRRVFYRLYLEKHFDETEKLAKTESFSPWLREMMRGQLHSSLGWESRGGGYASTVTSDGWKGFDQHMPAAAVHFRKAWQLHPDRADSAEQMIDVLKAGFGEPGETTRMWFDRSVAAQFDATGSYYGFVWSLRPRWGGSVDAVRSLLLACALTERPDTEVAEVALKLVDFVKSDSNAPDDRTVLQTPVLKEALLHTARRLAEEPTRVWERPWRYADLGVYAWKAAEYPLADDILSHVPVPFPRQTRRKIHASSNETSVRGESAIFALGMEPEWEAAQDLYAIEDIPQATLAYRDIASRFQGEPPAMLRERIAACKFETDFETGNWVKMSAYPDLAEWHHLSGPWKGSKEGTLSIEGQDAQGYVLHNGRVGHDFELRGEFRVTGKDPFQGLSIMLGYHRDSYEHFLACSQWGNYGDGGVATLLRNFAQTDAPRTILRSNDHTWRFHIFCQNGHLTFRLNHHDVLIDHFDRDDSGEAFEMPEDGLMGFCSHFFQLDTLTEIKHLEIRRLAPDEQAPATDLTGLHQLMQLEIADRVTEAKQNKRDAEAEKIAAFGKAVQSAGAKPVPLPTVTFEEPTLHSLLRGYRQSVAARLTRAGEPAEPRPDNEEPLAASHALNWQPVSGTWTLQNGVLTGSDDSRMNYDFNRTPPFQIDFEITAIYGLRPRVVMGKVSFANEGSQTTFGLYPRVKDAPLFSYEQKKPYQITIKATTDKTELFIDGTKVSDGPKVEGVVDVLQFRSGDNWAEGKAEFRKIRISSLPED